MYRWISGNGWSQIFVVLFLLHTFYLESKIHPHKRFSKICTNWQGEMQILLDWNVEKVWISWISSDWRILEFKRSLNFVNRFLVSWESWVSFCCIFANVHIYNNDWEVLRQIWSKIIWADLSKIIKIHYTTLWKQSRVAEMSVTVLPDPHKWIAKNTLRLTWKLFCPSKPTISQFHVSRS